MKVYRKKDGYATEHEPVDAREIVKTQPEVFTLSNPNATPGEVPETAGSVLLKTSQLQAEENAKNQFEQHAGGTAVRDAQSADDINPARRAEKAAAAASEAALSARAAANAAPTNATLKAAADAADKRAADLKAAADKATAEAAAADKALKAQRETERKAREAQAAKAGTPKQGTPMPPTGAAGTVGAMTTPGLVSTPRQ